MPGRPPNHEEGQGRRRCAALATGRLWSSDEAPVILSCSPLALTCWSAPRPVEVERRLLVGGADPGAARCHGADRGELLAAHDALEPIPGTHGSGPRFHHPDRPSTPTISAQASPSTPRSERRLRLLAARRQTLHACAGRERPAATWRCSDGSEPGGEQACPRACTNAATREPMKPRPTRDSARTRRADSFPRWCPFPVHVVKVTRGRRRRERRR